MARSAANEVNHPASALSTSLTRNQIRGFWASWGGWTLDGMDSFVYALVLVPSLRELLAALGYCSHQGQRRTVRRVALRPVSHWLGTCFPLGTDWRQVWPRAHPHADHPVVFGIHFSECLRHRRVATGNSSPARGHRHWRRMGHGRDVCGGGVAGGSTPRGCRV